MTETKFASATISNAGTGPLTVTSIATSGSDFQLELPLPFELPLTLVPAESVDVPMMFTPQTTGTRTGLLIVSSTALGSPHSIGLTGVGEMAEPEPEPPGSTAQYYASVASASSSSLTLTMPNGNPGDLLIVTLAGGVSASEFEPPVGWEMRHQYIEYEFMAVAWKVRGASEPNPTFTRPSGTTEVVGFCYNVFTTGRVLPTVLDDSKHRSITSPHASYICDAIMTTAPHSLLVFMTCARQWDNNLDAIVGPDSSTGLLFSDGILLASGTVPGVFTYGKWAQTGGAYNTGVPFNHRCFMAWWGGIGDTGQVAYPIPAGNARSTSFLLGFRTPP